MPTESTSEGPEPRLLLVDAAGERAESHTRLWAAMIAATGGLWLFAQGGGMVMAAFALAAIAFAMIWTMGWVRQRVENFQIDHRFLQINSEGLSVSDGRMLTTVGWDEVTSVSVDEDRLRVCVGVRDAEPLSLDDPYESVTPHELAEIIHQFHEHWKACSPPPDA